MSNRTPAFAACRTGKLFQEGRSFLNFRSKIPAASFSLDSSRRVGEVGGEHFLKSLAGKRGCRHLARLNPHELVVLTMPPFET